MSRRLLDTDILSEIIKDKDAAVAARAAAYLAQHGRFTTSAVTVAEIVYGFDGWDAKTASLSSRRPWRLRKFYRWTMRLGVWLDESTATSNATAA
jgi:predicted nucleic acid-binding protein